MQKAGRVEAEQKQRVEEQKPLLGREEREEGEGFEWGEGCRRHVPGEGGDWATRRRKRRVGWESCYEGAEG